MMLYPWQFADWSRLQAMRAKLPHAILLNGQDSSPPATLQEAEALTTQISDAIQQVSQEIEQAKESCS